MCENKNHILSDFKLSDLLYVLFLNTKDILIWFNSKGIKSIKPL